MNKVAGAFLVLALVAGVAFALAPLKGSVHAVSGTTPIVREFNGQVNTLVVAPVGNAVQVIHNPHYADQDTFTVFDGDVMTWSNMRPPIRGFTVIRTGGAASVDVYWWNQQ